MNTDAVSMGKSLLEKPLNLLTEDDIAQITREECRRFLKDKGMRRPSWNKSQAIQQVISLKALLEDRSDPDDPSEAVRIRPKQQSSPPPPPLLTPPHDASLSGDSRSFPSREKDPSPYRRKVPILPPFTAGDVLCHLPSTGKLKLPQQSYFPLPRAFSDEPLRQLTIFFGGKVNVYDGVPPAKAREIMQLAANPGTAYDAKSVAPISSGLPFLNRFTPGYTGPTWAGPSSGIRSCPNTPAGKLQRNFKGSLEEGRALRETVPECPMSRKASLKRYLEKRKDRYKGRRIIEGSSSSSMEFMHLSQKFSGIGQNEPSAKSNSGGSSMQPRPPCPPFDRCTSIETKKLGFSVNLNEDGARHN